MTTRAIWGRYTLGEAGQLVGGGTPSRTNQEYFGSDIDWVTPSDLPQIGQVTSLNGAKEGLSWKGLSDSSAKKLPPGTVLFSSRASIGKIAVTERWCCTNQGITSFVPIPDQVDPWFLAYFLAYSVPQIAQLAAKTTFKEVNRSKLRNFPFCRPPIGEQRRIVARIRACMERIDEIQQLRKEADQQAHALVPSVLASIFSGVANAYNTTSLRECLLESRYGTSQKCNASENATPVLRIPNVADGKISFNNLKYCHLEEKEMRTLKLEAGDLLIVRTNGSSDLVGRCAVFEGAEHPFAFASYLIRFRFNPSKADANYVSYFLTSTLGRDAIASIRRTSAGQYNINGENLRAIQFPLPPIEIQGKIVEQLREQQEIATQIADYQDLISDEFTHLRGAVLHKAFSGNL